jgi:C-terminal processing protease CtpA/Prc
VENTLEPFAGRKIAMKVSVRVGSVLLLLAGIVCGHAVAAHSQEKPELAGWERNSAYNKYYDVSEFDDFKGVVEEVVDITPLSGMAPGVGLKVKDQDGDMVEVHLGPKSFVKLDAIGLKPGDKVKVKGVWVALNDKDVFLASKVKKGEDSELKVRRTKDGAPYWTFTPEELAREKGD